MNCVDVKPDYKDSVCFLSVFCDVTSCCSVCFSSCEKSTKLFCFKLICSVIIPSSSWPLSSVLSTVSAPRVFSPESSVFSTSSASRHERIELNRKWLRAIDSIPDRKSVYSVRKEMLSQVDKFLLIKKPLCTFPRQSDTSSWIVQYVPVVASSQEKDSTSAEKRR